ncbi:MAG: hypothetical protein WBP61_06675, partial [Nocardioides sp.]
MRSAALALAAAVLLLGGCSSEQPVPGRPSATVQEPRPSAVVTPTQDAATARMQALARLAEEAAAELPEVQAPEARTGEVLGADISWPQCPRGLGIPERPTLGMPMPLPEAEYVVIGLTNGPGFTANPCLADQVAWVRERGLMASAYAVASYPDADQVAEHGDSGPYDGDDDLG